MPRTLKLTLAYNGARFHGWQVQPGHPTIQGALKEAWAVITGEDVLPQGSGRTDAGVHALAQVASLQTSSGIPAENLLKALNSRLPADIRVTEVVDVPPDFHARHSTTAKTYRYRIYRGSVLSPFLVGLVCHHPYPLDEKQMVEAARFVEGEHDFTSFAAADPDRASREGDDDEDLPSNVRRIFSSEFERDGDELAYTVRGNGFLHHMVRNLVGTFLKVGKGSTAVEDIVRIIDARDRSAAGATAPASGLYLVCVEY